MKLHIELPKNLVVEELVRQKNIPCLCRVSQNFELLFQEPLPDAVGIVSEWDRSLLDERAMAGAGGQYSHYALSMVTLQSTAPDVYHIVDLSFFNRSVGWCPIIVDGDYGPPGNFWDEDE